MSPSSRFLTYLYKAKENWDIQKQDEISKKINELRNIKIKELEESIKKWDETKTIELRKEMRIFSFYRS